jgi:phosphate starvation-inducible protein PhoH and related proteins
LTRQRSKPVLTANPKLERQAKRLTRQQKRLEQDFMTASDDPVKLTMSRGKTIRFADIKKIEPMTDTQEDVFDAYHDTEALVLYGSAGTGKSFIALYHALVDVLDPDTDYEKILIVRSTVQSRSMGFLPGTSEEKTEPFELPYHDIFATILGRPDAYEKLKDMGKVEFVSTSFLRGSTFNNSIVFFDESQNATLEEIRTVSTRIGKFSKFIVAGDGMQNDLIHSRTDVSGFRDFLSIASRMSEFRTFKFTTDDIVRSGFVKSFLIACEKLGL